MTDLDVAYADATLSVCTARNLLIAVWRDAPTLDQMRALGRADQARRRRVRGGIGFLNVVLEGVPRFSAEVRDEAARQTADRDERDLAAAHLVLLDGLTGLTVRTFISTVLLIGRPKYPNKVFGDLGACTTWLAPLISEPSGAQWTDLGVKAAIDAARAVRSETPRDS